MPLSIAGYKTQKQNADLVPLTIEFGNDTLNIEYRSVLAITLNEELETLALQERAANFQEQAEAMGDDAQPSAEMISTVADLKLFTATQLVMVVAKWDLTDIPGGEVIPLTEDAVKNLPNPLIEAILRAIAKDRTPGEAKGEKSS